MSGNQDAFSNPDWELVYKSSLLCHTPKELHRSAQGRNKSPPLRLKEEQV